MNSRKCIKTQEKQQDYHTGVSNLRPMDCTQPRIAVNAAQHKIVNLLKRLWDVFVITCRNVFNVWLKTTLLPMWHRDAKGWTPCMVSEPKPVLSLLSSLFQLSETATSLHAGVAINTGCPSTTATSQKAQDTSTSHPAQSYLMLKLSSR